ncbi:MAG TPA: hypothetical protein VJ306_19435 [Pyrinomonadaceae bacterium]|jgi:hypothetical protein|nr:hypothetical protein [Pyrinomonadaceae bacterium]
MNDNPFVGSWSYRSFLNDPDLSKDKNMNKLLFGDGTLVITAPSSDTLGGTIGGNDWSLDLHGSIGYGSPAQIRFQGKGIVKGEEWIYDYIGWLVPVWPNSTDILQVPAIVGSVTRTIPHSGDEPGTVNPAGVVASFYAVRQP